MDAPFHEPLRLPLRRGESWLDRLGTAFRTHAYAALSDENLVARARARDTVAFDVLVSRHRDRLYHMALDSLGTPRAAAEALCEAALSALRDLDSTCATRTPRAWLYMHGFRAVFRRLGIPPGPLVLDVHGTPSPALTDGSEPSQTAWARRQVRRDPR